MRNVFLIILVTSFISTAISAQDEPFALKVDGMHDIYPAGAQGVVLMDRTLKQMTDGTITIGFTGYDDHLQKKWTNYYPVRKGMTLAFRKVDEKGIYLLFASKDRKEYELILGSTAYGDYEVSRYTFSEAFLVSELEAYYDQVWLSGIIGAHPVVFKLNSENGAYQTVPVGISGALKYVGQLHYHEPTKSLDYVMIAGIDKKEVVIWRSITAEGKVLVNEKLAFDRNRVRGLRAARLDDQNLAITGQYVIGQRERVEGLFSGVVGANPNLEFRDFKQVKAISTYRRFKDIERKTFDKAKSVRFNKANKQVYFDQISVNKAGEVEVTVEVYTDNFQVRGTLEKEVIARDRTAQIDQNTYGRRSALSGQNNTEELEDLMARGSATDLTQYRYMEQSLSKALSAGMFYSHTGHMKFSPDMKLLEETAVFFGLKDQGRLISQQNYQDGVLQYFNNGGMLSFDTKNKLVTDKELTSRKEIQLLPWYDKTVLGVDFDKEGRGFTLYRFSLD